MPISDTREIVVYAARVKDENIIGALILTPSLTMSDVRRMIVEVVPWIGLANDGHL